MDPYISTIIKQAAGAVVALIYGFVQYSKYQYALSLNMVPGQLS